MANANKQKFAIAFNNALKSVRQTNFSNGNGQANALFPYKKPLDERQLKDYVFAYGEILRQIQNAANGSLSGYNGILVNAISKHYGNFLKETGLPIYEIKLIKKAEFSQKAKGRAEFASEHYQRISDFTYALNDLISDMGNQMREKVFKLSRANKGEIYRYQYEQYKLFSDIWIFNMAVSEMRDMSLQLLNPDYPSILMKYSSSGLYLIMNSLSDKTGAEKAYSSMQDRQ